MAIDRIIFQAAVSEHLSADVAARLPEAWKVAPPSPPDTDCDADAGRALAIALSTYEPATAAPQVDSLTLYGVELQGSEGSSIHLAPADAYQHPLLADWTPTTFADLLGECIRAGRIAAHLSPNTPTFGSFEIVEEDGVIRQGAALLTFDTTKGSLRVVLRYGQALSAAFSRANMATGDGVFMAGVASRVCPPLPPSPEPPPTHPTVVH